MNLASAACIHRLNMAQLGVGLWAPSKKSGLTAAMTRQNREDMDEICLGYRTEKEGVGREAVRDGAIIYLLVQKGLLSGRVLDSEITYVFTYLHI